MDMTGSFIAWLFATFLLTLAGLSSSLISTGVSVSSMAYPLASRDDAPKFKGLSCATAACFFELVCGSKKYVAGGSFLALFLISRACYCFASALTAFFPLLLFSSLAFCCASVQVGLCRLFMGLSLQPFGLPTLPPAMVALLLLSLSIHSSLLLFSYPTNPPQVWNKSPDGLSLGTCGAF